MKFAKSFSVFAIGLMFAFGHHRTLAQTNSWEETNGPNVPVLALAVNSSEHAFAGTAGYGIFRSQNNGDSWETINSGLTNLWVTALSINSSGHVFAATYGNGVFRSQDNGDNWIAPDNRSTDFFVNALAINSNDQLFAGIVATSNGRGVFRSFDNGRNWAAINNGLTSDNVNALAINTSGHIFAGTQDGKIFRSLNNGNDWAVAITGLLSTNIRSLIINSSGHIFVGDDLNWIYRSINNGDNWSALKNAVNPVASVRALAINSSGHIFAGVSGHGVFRSTDNGDNWTAFNTGLTNAFVSSLVFNSNGRIFAGTNTRVFRSTQSTTAVREKEADGKMPSSFTLPQNHPNPFNPSTQITFALPSAQKVTLKVFDLSGKEVATLLQNEQKAAGVHEVTFEAQALPSGVYFYQLQAGDLSTSSGQSLVATRKMLLVR